MKTAIALVIIIAATIVAVEYTPPFPPTFDMKIKRVVCTIDDRGWPEGGYIDMKSQMFLGIQPVGSPQETRTHMSQDIWLEMLNQKMVMYVNNQVVTQRAAEVICGMIDALAKKEIPTLSGKFSDQIPHAYMFCRTNAAGVVTTGVEYR